MYNHQTAKCPHCNKDSWQSEFKAMFEPVKCMWCEGTFKYEPGVGSVKISNEKTKKKA